MKRLSWLSIFVLSFTSIQAFAQGTLPTITINNIALLHEHISNSEDLNTSLQRIGSSFVLFVKFDLNDNLEAKNLEFSGSGPQVIKEALKTSVLSFSKFPKLTDEERRYIKGKHFILPFFYYYDPSNYGTDEIKKLTPAERTEQLQNLVFKMNKDLNEFNKSIRQMLNFEGESLSNLDCILIKPIVHSVIQ